MEELESKIQIEIDKFENPRAFVRLSTRSSKDVALRFQLEKTRQLIENELKTLECSDDCEVSQTIGTTFFLRGAFLLTFTINFAQHKAIIRCSSKCLMVESGKEAGLYLLKLFVLQIDSLLFLRHSFQSHSQ